MGCCPLQADVQAQGLLHFACSDKFGSRSKSSSCRGFQQLARNTLTNLRKKCTINKFNRKTRGFEESLDDEKFIKEFTRYYQNIDYPITMATQNRHWRPELDCPEVLDQNFIIFDNFDSFKYWKNNTKDFHSSMQGLQSNIIQCELFTEYFCDSDFAYFRNFNDFVTENESEFLAVDERKNDIFDGKLKCVSR